MGYETHAIQPAYTETRAAICAKYGADEAGSVRALADRLDLAPDGRKAVADEAARLIRPVRDDTDPTMMEAFLDDYGLSTDEGVGLRRLAEALLRVPDAETIDDLIEDKIARSDWSAHLGHSFSPLVNASTWAPMLTGRVLASDPSRRVAGARHLIKRLGEPVVRAAGGRAMKIMGQHFVLGQTIEEGINRAEKLRARGTPNPTTCWAGERGPRPMRRPSTTAIRTPSPRSPRSRRATSAIIPEARSSSRPCRPGT